MVPRQSVVPITVLAVKEWNPDSLRCDMFLNLSFPTVFTVVLHPVRGTQTSRRQRIGAQLPEQPHKARGKVPCTLGLRFQVMHYL